MASLTDRVRDEGFTPLNRTMSSFVGTSQKMDAVEFTSQEPGSFMNEQMISFPGTLPPPSSDKNIEAARAKAEAKDYSLLHKIPMELAKTPGYAGQQLRRVMLHGTSIVFFTPGYEGKRFIYERAKELGVRCIIIDQPGSWAESLVEEQVITKFIGIDLLQSSDNVFRDTLAAIKALDQDPALDFKRPTGVCTFCELSVPIVARLAEHLGLPGITSAAVDVARDKHRTRAAMQAAKLPSPACFRITAASELRAAADKVGFPAVLKPLSGAASLGVKKILSLEELESSYAEVMKEMRSTVVTSGALVKRGSKDSKVSEEEIVFILEEYLDGVEVDVDIVMSDGEAEYCVVVDNGPTAEPYFAETWGCCPSLLPADQQAELKNLSVDALKACGFKAGVFHVECKLTSRGARLIEINARMGGGQVRETHLLCSGVDLVEETLFTTVGIPCVPYGVPAVKALAYNYVVAHKSGTMGELQPVLDRVNKREAVIYAKPLVKPGDEITGPKDGLPTWIADIMVKKDSPKEALDYVLKLSEELVFPMEE